MENSLKLHDETGEGFRRVSSHTLTIKLTGPVNRIVVTMVAEQIIYLYFDIETH